MNDQKVTIIIEEGRKPFGEISSQLFQDGDSKYIKTSIRGSERALTILFGCIAKELMKIKTFSEKELCNIIHTACEMDENWEKYSLVLLRIFEKKERSV